MYNQIINGNNWENLETGIYGRVYTSYFWKPDILWGGGTQNHLNDPLNYGAWKPKSMANYYVHDSTKHLTLIGNGCANKLFDTTSVTTAMNRIRNIVNAVSYGVVPDTGFYTATVFMSNGQFNTAQLNKMKQLIDSVSVFVAQGKIQWKNLNEIYEIWNTDYNKKPFWIQCAQIPEVYSVINISSIPEGFYNEVSSSLNMRDTVAAYLRSTTSPYSIIDSSTRKIDSLTFTGSFAFVNVVSGTYYIALKHRNSIETWSKSGGIEYVRGSIMSYNFTSAQSQAFGNNLILKAGKYCVYSGDVDQDGIIDANDMSLIDNDAFLFSSGYLSTDVNGDGIVDADDISIADNHSYNFISIIRP